jgi:hypothetical protein
MEMSKLPFTISYNHVSCPFSAVGAYSVSERDLEEERSLVNDTSLVHKLLNCKTKDGNHSQAPDGKEDKEPL